MLEFEAYKTYHAYATGKKIPKPKYVKNKVDPESSPKKKSAPASEGKRLKTSAKVSTPAKKKQPATTSKAKALNVPSEVALSEVEQMKLATKRSKTQLYNSHASGSGADEGTGVTPGVPDVPIYDSEDEQISWKSSNEDDDEVNVSEDNDDQYDADNEDDDDQDDADNKDDDEERQDEEDKEGDGSNLRVQTPSHYESTDDEESDEVTQGGNVEGEELNEETNEEEETNVKGTQVIEDTHVIMTTATPKVQQQSSSVSSGFISNMLNPNPDTCIDSIINLNTKSTYLVDVSISMTVEMPPSSTTTIPSPLVTLIQPLLRDEAQAENTDFINKLDDNIKKIIKEQVKVQVKDQISKILLKFEKLVNDQLESEVLTFSSNEAKTSHAIAANLSELELKKILIDKMERSKRRRAGKGPKSTSAPKEKTSKSSGKSKEGSKSHNTSIGKSAQAEEPIHANEDLEEPVHQEFDTGFTEDQPVDETTQHHDWFQKPIKPPTPDRDWNKTLPAVHGPIQPWIRNLVQKEDTRDLFNELMDTHLDFLAFVMNRLKVDTLTP
ncbi:hypothetical protein Tco_0132540 [Tanacetum coccineum]